MLSYGVRRRYHSSKSKQLPSSAKILHDLGKIVPEAASVYEKCFPTARSSASEGNSPGKLITDEYAVLQTSSPAERKVLWIRVALIEGKLLKIIEGLMQDPRQVGVV